MKFLRHLPGNTFKDQVFNTNIRYVLGMYDIMNERILEYNNLTWHMESGRNAQFIVLTTSQKESKMLEDRTDVGKISYGTKQSL
jgi:hypothetical protein